MVSKYSENFSVVEILHTLRIKNDALIIHRPTTFV